MPAFVRKGRHVFLLRVSDYVSKGDAHCKGHVSFITKAGVFSIPSPIMKAHTSPFIMKVGTSPIPYIKEFCGFLKNMKVPSSYSMNVSSHISFLDLKVAPSVMSHDYHILLT
jgi:hypothetical protein